MCCMAQSLSMCIMCIETQSTQGSGLLYCFWLQVILQIKCKQTEIVP